MRIRLCAEPMRPSRQEVEIEIPDGLTDEQIDDHVQSDLEVMAGELVDAWWERL